VIDHAFLRLIGSVPRPRDRHALGVPGRRVGDSIVKNPAGGKAGLGPGVGRPPSGDQSNVTTPRATWPVRSAAKPSLISSIL
jgi:hypothetical protein